MTRDFWQGKVVNPLGFLSDQGKRWGTVGNRLITYRWLYSSEGWWSVWIAVVAVISLAAWDGSGKRTLYGTTLGVWLCLRYSRVSLGFPDVKYHLCVHIIGIQFGVWVSHPAISCTTEAFAVNAWPVAQKCPTAIRMGSITSGKGGSLS